MAHLACDVFSESLERGASLTVVLPDGVSDPPVLYLLHGMSDDHTAWTRETAVERYATDAGVALVMPALGRSFCADERYGAAYWTYLADELPGLVASMFRLPDDRGSTYAAGLSMGGYGAVKLALNRPDRFAAAASIAGALDIGFVLENAPDHDDLRRRVFADGLRDEEDLIGLLATADPSALPRLRVACGLDDWLLSSNQRFVDAATAAGVAVEVDIGPGDHDWAYADQQIVSVLDWLGSTT